MNLQQLQNIVPDTDLNRRNTKKEKIFNNIKERTDKGAYQFENDCINVTTYHPSKSRRD